MIWIFALSLAIFLSFILLYFIRKSYQTLRQIIEENAALHYVVGDNNKRKTMPKEEWERKLEYLKIIEEIVNKTEEDEKKEKGKEAASILARRFNPKFYQPTDKSVPPLKFPFWDFTK